jgi:hypothetical protein
MAQLRASPMSDAHLKLTRPSMSILWSAMQLVPA